jgi:[ribosomal protein S5]-alanine N-acetyltransferase
MGTLSEAAVHVCTETAGLYTTVGYSPPWIGYLALQGSRVVGTCAFPAGPKDGRVEIAYFTFPEFERQGIATQMARALLAIAQEADPRLEVFAHTLAKGNASNSVLRKLGFVFARAVPHPDEGMVWEWCRWTGQGGS